MRSPLCDLKDEHDEFLSRVVKKGPLLVAPAMRKMSRQLTRLGLLFIVPSRTLIQRKTGVADLDEAILKRKLWAVHATPEGVAYTERRGSVHRL